METHPDRAILVAVEPDFLEKRFKRSQSGLPVVAGISYRSLESIICWMKEEHYTSESAAPASGLPQQIRLCKK